MANKDLEELEAELFSDGDNYTKEVKEKGKMPHMAFIAWI